MGWPIFWTHINAEQNDDQKAGAARSTAEWREVLQMRLSNWFDEAPRGLQQAIECGDPVSLMPLDTPWERAGDEADSLPNVRLDVHTDEDSQVGHLQQPGMPQEVGRDVCCETLGQSGYDGKLRVLPDGIHQDTPAPDDMRSVVWQQAGMAEKAMTNRTQRLKCIGNGVVAAQAGFAACILIARATGAFQ